GARTAAGAQARVPARTRRGGPGGQGQRGQGQPGIPGTISAGPDMTRRTPPPGTTSRPVPTGTATASTSGILLPVNGAARYRLPAPPPTDPVAPPGHRRRPGAPAAAATAVGPPGAPTPTPARP